ncbi:MAG: hypothetical protein JSW38_03055 [Dehalococcoidia bacterium]|nr:MAG: hypothetical protein JSW38_03055 [Dehalococcoidia bacterium]
MKLGYRGTKLELEHHITDDNQLRLALQGEGHGELYFQDFMAFVAFIEMCCDVAEEYNDLIKECSQCVTTESPIPRPFLSAFYDSPLS